MAGSLTNSGLAPTLTPNPLGQNPLTDLSQILGGYVNNAAQGNYLQGQAQQNQANTAANIYRTGVETALQAPPALAKSAVLGDLMSNIQPVSLSGVPSYVHVPQISGGLTPAALGPGTRLAGAQLTRQSLMNLMGNGSSNPFAIPQAPTLQPLPQMSGFDKALGGASLGAGILGALSGGGGKFSFNAPDIWSGIKGIFGHGGDSGDPSDPNSSAYNPYADPSNYDQQGNFLGGYDAYGNLMPGDGMYGGDTSGGDFTDYGGF